MIIKFMPKIFDVKFGFSTKQLMSDFVKIIGPYHCKHYDRTFDSQLREEMHIRIHFHFFPAFRRNQIQSDRNKCDFY